MLGGRFLVLFFVGFLISEISSTHTRVRELAKQYEARLNPSQVENNPKIGSNAPKGKRLSVKEMASKIDKHTTNNQIDLSSETTESQTQLEIPQPSPQLVESTTSTSSNQITPQKKSQKPIDTSYMYNLQDLFKKAQTNAIYLRKISDGDRQELYALGMQATVGDCNTARPQSKGVAEWNAWNHKKGTNREKAKQDYVNKVKNLVKTVGLK